VRKLIQHLVVFAAVNGLLIAIWLLVGGGSPEKLSQVIASPADALKLGFWPVWPILAWGTLLVIHAGWVASEFAFGGSARRRRRRMAKEATSAGKDIAKEVVAAIDRAHERRMQRDARREARRAKQEPTPASTPERKWVTVMFCDIADSTLHNERLGDDEWHRVLGQIRGVVRSALAGRGGSEVGTQGDGMLSRFESPSEAVLCGIDIQTELGQARQTSDFVPEVRIGVHAGDAVEEQGDLVGRVINLASRVTDEATPGEILVTEPVADQLIGKLELEDKGLRPLKGMSQPRHLLAVRWSQETDTTQT
jgi:class 3 adenylate cyclase